MLELKVQDLRLRGRGFTLYQAAKEKEVNCELIDSLLTAIYCKLGLCSGDYDKEEKIKKENPNILDRISKADFDLYSLGKKIETGELIRSGLVTLEGNEYVLTSKAISVIKRGAEIQKELDEKNFHCCPCSYI